MKLRNTVVAVIASALITPIASADVSFRDINLVEGEFESVYQFNKYMQRNNIYESMGEGESMHKKNIDLFLATQHFAGDETLSIVKRKATKYHQFFDRAVADNNGKYYGGRTGIAKGVCDDAHIFASAYK